MTTGENSEIIQAISDVQKMTTTEIRVHLSKRWVETNPMKRARRIFRVFRLAETEHRNAVLLYVNLRRKKIAVVGDTAVHQVLGQKYWDELILILRRNLQATSYERAIAITVLGMAPSLKKYFPLGS